MSLRNVILIVLVIVVALVSATKPSDIVPETAQLQGGGGRVPGGNAIKKKVYNDLLPSGLRACAPNCR